MRREGKIKKRRGGGEKKTRRIVECILLQLCFGNDRKASVIFRYLEPDLGYVLFCFESMIIRTIEILYGILHYQNWGKLRVIYFCNLQKME